MRPLLFILLLFFAASCTKTELPKGEDNLFFVQFAKNGDTIRFEDGVDNYGNGPGVASYEDSVGRLHSELTVFVTNPADTGFGLNTLSIQMVKFFNDTRYPALETSQAMFNSGSYDFGLYTLDSSRAGIDGVVIQYVDADSTIWTTDTRLGQQESWANFQISSNTEISNKQFGAKTKGTFNCRVFDGNNNYLDLTEGSFHARTVYNP